MDISSIHVWWLYYSPGFQVTKEKLWKSMCAETNPEISESSAAGYQLRKHYQRHLLTLECLETGKSLDEAVAFADKQKRQRSRKEGQTPQPGEYGSCLTVAGSYLAGAGGRTDSARLITSLSSRGGEGQTEGGGGSIFNISVAVCPSSSSQNPPGLADPAVAVAAKQCPPSLSLSCSAYRPSDTVSRAGTGAPLSFPFSRWLGYIFSLFVVVFATVYLLFSRFCYFFLD